MPKIGHDAKAIAFAKWSVWVRNLKCQKGAKNDCTTTLELLCAKKPLQNTLNIWKMEAFLKWPKLATTKRL